MAYDYLGLVNDLCLRFNEVPLTSTNFASAQGSYGQFKLAVNTAINRINIQKFEWPFNHVTQSTTLVANQTRYALPSDLKSLKLDSFRLPRDGTFNIETIKLKPIDYEEYLEKYLDAEYNSAKSGVPQYIFRTPDLEYGLYPPPKEAYTLIYEYYSLPDELTLHSDVPTLPSYFRYLIGDGAKIDVYAFRGDVEASLAQEELFKNNLKDMKLLVESRVEYMRSSQIIR